MASERSKELAALAWIGAGIFMLAAMLSYEEVVKSADRWDNVCGHFGFVLARALLGQLGFAAYLIPIALIGEGVRLFGRFAARPIALRAVGILLFMPMLAAVLNDALGGHSTRIPDPGGDVGIVLARLLKHEGGLGLFGGRIAMAVLLLITFVLYADLLYSRSALNALQWVERRGGVARLFGFGGRSAEVPSRSAKRERGDERAASDASEPVASSNAELDADLARSLESDRAVPAAERVPPGAPKRRPKRRAASVGAAVDAAVASDDFVADEETQETVDDEVDLAPRTSRSKKTVKSTVISEVDAAAGGADAGNDEGMDDGAGDDESRGDDQADDDAGQVAARAAESTAVEPSATPAVGDDESEAPPSPIATPIPAMVAPRKAQLPIKSTLIEPPEPPLIRPNAPYQFPPYQLLDPPERESGGDFIKFTEEAARKLTTALKSFKVEACVVGVQRGPSITMLEVELAAGTKLTRLRALEDDLAMALAAQSVRIVAPIPGKSTAGIEIPNDAREIVRMSELLQWQGWNPQKYAIPICLGKDSSGAPRIEDLAKMPHLLVAGSTGSGKSVCLNTLIMSILFTRTPEQVKLILIDPKMVELSSFQNVPHLMCPVVTDMKRAAGILEWAVEKMEERYALLHKVGVRNIYAYNKVGDEEVKRRLGDEFSEDFETTLPFVVIVMDELADLMLSHGKDVEQSITRLAQKSRAVGIHVILATQRPSTNVITGLIKANLPTRIAFRVTSKIDSRVILDQNGADKLLGQGDMLYVPPGSADLSRVQGCFVTDQEIRQVVDFLADQGPPLYSRELVQKHSASDKDPSEVDDLFDDAAKFVVETQRGSASLLQRRFAIGYTRASRLIDLMANDGLLGDFKGSQAREVLCTSMEELAARRTEQRQTRGVKTTSKSEPPGESATARDPESSGLDFDDALEGGNEGRNEEMKA